MTIADVVAADVGYDGGAIAAVEMTQITIEAMDLQQPQHRQREQQCKYIFKLTRDHTLRLLPLAGRISLAFPSCCTCVTVCVCGPETSVRVPSDTPMYPWRTRRKRGRIGCLPTILVRCVLVCRLVTVHSFSLFFSSLFPSSLLLFSSFLPIRCRLIDLT